MGNFFSSRCNDRLCVVFCEHHALVEGEKNEVPDSKSIASKESSAFTSLLELYSDLLVRLIEIFNGSGILFIRNTLWHIPARTMFLIPEILKSFEKPVNEEGFLRIVLWIETVLCSEAAQDCKPLIELAALIIPQR